jgi:plastocyanin
VAPEMTGTWDSGLLKSGETSSRWTSTDPGTFPYFCQLHPGQVGTVVVTG